MKVSIHQPDYIPYLGLFYKMYRSDIFIYLDDAQYSNLGAQNYNVIKTPQGVLRLKFPVENKFGDAINVVRPKDELNWKEKHLKTIEMNYKKAPFFKDVFPKLKDVYMGNYPTVADLNIAINTYIAENFGIKPKFYRSSEFNIHTAREERVIDLCLAVNADCYISGTGASVYQVEDHFVSKGIKLCYSDYKPITYPQIWGDFQVNMSVIDYIFNCGYDFEYVIKEVERLNGNR